MLRNYNKTKITVSEIIGIAIKCSRLKFDKITYSSQNRFPLFPLVLELSLMSVQLMALSLCLYNSFESFGLFFHFIIQFDKIVTIWRALNLLCKSKLGQFSKTNESIKLITERDLKEKHQDRKKEFSDIINSICFSSPN